MKHETEKEVQMMFFIGFFLFHPSCFVFLDRIKLSGIQNLLFI